LLVLLSEHERVARYSGWDFSWFYSVCLWQFWDSTLKSVTTASFQILTYAPFIVIFLSLSTLC